MANSVIHKANTRGHADHGWLRANHTFSFANYYDPARVRFGTLRVLNDDWVAPGMGFGSHPHDNMEIVTIPLDGALRHADNLGNEEVIRCGDVQVMSAGKGIIHSEFNDSDVNPVSLLQIWVFPNRKGVDPRYGQISLDLAGRNNTLQQIVSPYPGDGGLWIYQDAWFNLGIFDSGVTFTYDLKKHGNGLYLFVIKGAFEVEGTVLEHRDGFGLWDVNKIQVASKSAGSELLLMDLPMTL